jgi:glutathione S-transferase
MKLYYSPGACSLAAHIIADEANLRLQLERVDLRSHRTENGQDYYGINPKGYVPTIQLDDGNTLTENMAILNYLADRTANKLFTPKRGTLEHYRLEEWLGFISSELHKSFAPLFHNGTFEEKRKAKERLVEHFAYAAMQLDDQPFLMGEHMTVADPYFFVMLTWAKKLNLNLKRYTNLERFYARFSARPAVKRAMLEEGLPLAA